MITGLARVLTLHLAVVLALTASILATLAYLSPAAILAGRVSLLQVIPGNLKDSSASVDGPSVFMGNLGSCSKSKNDSPLTCVPPSFEGIYDLSVLPKSAPYVLEKATASTGGFILFSLCLTGMFLVLFVLSCIRHKLGEKFGAVIDKVAIQRFMVWSGLLGFMIGLTAQLINRMWFGKAAEDFNRLISQDNDAPQLVASTGNGFIMVYVAYSFLAVPLVASMMKLQALPGSSSSKA